jgi:hypothetical protein
MTTKVKKELVSDEKFIVTFQRAAKNSNAETPDKTKPHTWAGVAEALGIQAQSVASRVKKLRKHGVPLAEMKRAPNPPRKDYEALALLAMEEE